MDGSTVFGGSLSCCHVVCIWSEQMLLVLVAVAGAGSRQAGRGTGLFGIPPDEIALHRDPQMGPSCLLMQRSVQECLLLFSTLKQEGLGGMKV